MKRIMLGIIAAVLFSALCAVVIHYSTPVEASDQNDGRRDEVFVAPRVVLDSHADVQPDTWTIQRRKPINRSNRPTGDDNGLEFRLGGPMTVKVEIVNSGTATLCVYPFRYLLNAGLYREGNPLKGFEVFHGEPQRDRVRDIQPGCSLEGQLALDAYLTEPITPGQYELYICYYQTYEHYTKIYGLTRIILGKRVDVIVKR